MNKIAPKFVTLVATYIYVVRRFKDLHSATYIYVVRRLRVKEERRVMLDAIATRLGIGHIAVQEMTGSLGYQKICARSVPRLLTEDHKVQRKTVTSEMLRRC